MNPFLCPALLALSFLGCCVALLAGALVPRAHVAIAGACRGGCIRWSVVLASTLQTLLPEGTHVQILDASPRQVCVMVV